MKLGTLVQFAALGKVLDTGYVSNMMRTQKLMWVECVKMGPQRVAKTHNVGGDK